MSNYGVEFEEKSVSEGSCSNASCCPPPQATVKRDQPKIGRNDPCLCGSQKKYKKCCGKAA